MGFGGNVYICVGGWVMYVSVGGWGAVSTINNLKITGTEKTEG